MTLDFAWLEGRGAAFIFTLGIRQLRKVGACRHLQSAYAFLGSYLFETNYITICMWVYVEIQYVLSQAVAFRNKARTCMQKRTKLIRPHCVNGVVFVRLCLDEVNQIVNGMADIAPDVDVHESKAQALARGLAIRALCEDVPKLRICELVDAAPDALAQSVTPVCSLWSDAIHCSSLLHIHSAETHGTSHLLIRGPIKY